jgi:hypothetical protein
MLHKAKAACRVYCSPYILNLSIFPVGQARLNKARWMSVHLEQGGATKFLDRVWNIWGNSYATSAILHFLLFDPASATVCHTSLRGKRLGLRLDVTKLCAELREPSRPKAGHGIYLLCPRHSARLGPHLVDCVNTGMTGTGEARPWPRYANVHKKFGIA